MGEVQVAGAFDVEDLARWQTVDATAAGDFPLAHSLRRRKQERDHPEPMIASHDSVI